MSNHTPGTWHVQPLQRDHGASIAIVGGDGIIAVIPPMNEDEDPDEDTAERSRYDEANARLIARAPRMHDALAAIAGMKITPETNYAELCALMIAVAKGEINE